MMAYESPAAERKRNRFKLISGRERIVDFSKSVSIKKVIAAFPLGIIMCDENQRCAIVNAAVEDLLGVKTDELLYQFWYACIHPKTQQNEIKHWLTDTTPGKPQFKEFTVRHQNNDLIWVRAHRCQLSTETQSEQAVHLLIFEDISHQKSTDSLLTSSENALHEQQQRAQVTLDSIGDAVLTTNLKGEVTYLNREAENMTGWDAQQAIGLPLATVFNIVDGQTRLPAKDPAERAITQNKIVELAMGSLLIRRDGSEVAIEDSAAPIHSHDKAVLGAVIVFHHAAKSRQMMEKVAKLAWHDFLTDLPNLALFTERLSQAIGSAHRHKKRVALLFVDMDDFKQINDTIGHLNGDSALKLMAERLLSCVRTTDTICRRSGDEFIVLLNEVERIEDVIQIAKHMLSATAEPAEINGHQVTLSSSIGISIFPEDGDNLTSLMQSADNAMYEAKKLGHSHYHYVKHAKSRQRKNTLSAAI